MEKQRKSPVLYLGVFAVDPKEATKTVKAVCKQSLLEVLKYFNPEAYLQEGQVPTFQEQRVFEKNLQPQEIASVEKDLASFETFNCPKDNYHITTLFLGRKKDNLNKKDKQILANWNNKVKNPIKVDFIVYVPNYLMAGYVSDLGKTECSNQHPHITLLLKQKASAVESNAILELIDQKVPEIFKKRDKKVYSLNISYLNVSKTIFVIENPFELQGVTGDNSLNGQK